MPVSPALGGAAVLVSPLQALLVVRRCVGTHTTTASQFSACGCTHGWFGRDGRAVGLGPALAPAPLPSLLLLWQLRLLVDHGVSLGLVVGHRRYKDRVLVRAGWSIGSCGRAAAVVAWVGSSCGLGGHGTAGRTRGCAFRASTPFACCYCSGCTLD